MMMLCCWWAACYLEDNQWPVGMGGPKSSDRTCADVIGFTRSYKTWPCRTLEGEGPGCGWRCTSWISGAITTENQFRNCDRQPRLAAVVHHARVYYEMLLHFIDDWNEAVGRVEWGILGREFLPHSTRPTASFQSSEIHGDTRYARISYLRRIFLYTDDWRSRSVIYERSE